MNSTRLHASSQPTPVPCGSPRGRAAGNGLIDPGSPTDRRTGASRTDRLRIPGVARLAAVACAFVVSGCSVFSVDTSELDRLREERSAWEGQGIVSYDMVFEQNCFCDPETLRPVEIHVRNGQTVSVTRVNTGEEIPSSQWQTYPNIDQLYDLLDAWLRLEDTVASATYDATYHYPVRASGNTKGQLDSQRTYNVSEFRKQ